MSGELWIATLDPTARFDCRARLACDEGVENVISGTGEIRLQPMTQSTPALAAPSGAGLSVRLSVMMLLQYAVWGLWMPILAAYLGTPVAGVPR